MTEPQSQAPLSADPEGYAPTVARRLAFYQRAGGIITPIMTAVVAFLMGGIVVLSTGHNPWRTYKAIFEGSGLNWFFHVGNHSLHVPFTDSHVWFWWDTNTNHTAAYNLTQTLLTTTPLILTGLAVAFAFRCGLFNIGGQGQYLMGTIVGVYIGSRFTDMGHLPHVLFALTCAALAGALWGAIAGFLKATVGAHEVITTIMLNWIAYWGGSYLFGRDGPLQNHFNKAVPISDDIVDNAKLPTLWGNPHLRRCTSASSSRSEHSSPSTSSSTGRRSATRCEPSGSIPRQRVTAASASHATSSSRWRSPGSSRAWPAASTSSAGSSGSGCSTCRYRTLASSASQSRYWGATRPSGSAWPRSCSAAC
jgi:ABC-type uncharacterized transport system permease subunit